VVRVALENLEWIESTSTIRLPTNGTTGRPFPWDDDEVQLEQLYMKANSTSLEDSKVRSSFEYFFPSLLFFFLRRKSVLSSSFLLFFLVFSEERERFFSQFEQEGTEPLRLRTTMWTASTQERANGLSLRLLPTFETTSQQY
jgi:hypothetical protein